MILEDSGFYVWKQMNWREYVFVMMKRCRYYKFINNRILIYEIFQEIQVEYYLFSNFFLGVQLLSDMG